MASTSHTSTTTTTTDARLRQAARDACTRELPPLATTDAGVLVVPPTTATHLPGGSARLVTLDVDTDDTFLRVDLQSSPLNLLDDVDGDDDDDGDGDGDMTSPEAIRGLQRRFEVQLRHLSAESTLADIGLERGYRMEDLLCLILSAPPAAQAVAKAWWQRRLGDSTSLEIVEDQGSGDTFALQALFSGRGLLSTSQRQAYDVDDVGRVRVEAFELHVTEHCNLRCAHCCNTSPYLSEKTLSPGHIADTLARMGGAIHADVFKIMGGEPLLHPEITEVVRVVRNSGVGDVVRLFTNGLLLHKMDDDFWRALDHLTVSSYQSAPVRPEHVRLIEDKAAQFDVVLNIKPVEAFSQVMHNERRHDDAAVAQTYRDCWLRHRCLVARDGRFFACTRVAYLTDLHERLQLKDPFDNPAALRDADSVPLDADNLGPRIQALLNRQTPFEACRFCLGGDGPRESHRQLSRDDVKAGRLRRLPILAA